MTGCALSRGSVASYFAAGGRFSHDCELIRLGGVSKQLLSCLNRCFDEPRSGGMRRTRECVVACESFYMLRSSQLFKDPWRIFFRTATSVDQPLPNDDLEVYNQRWMDHCRLDCAHQGHALRTQWPMETSGNEMSCPPCISSDNHSVIIETSL